MIWGSKSTTTVHDVTEFRSILHREYHRSNRYGKAFSCIVFKTDEVEGSQSFNRKLVKAISSRIRSVDQTGWYNSKDIGVLLVGADTENAKKVARDVLDRFPPVRRAPSFAVYSHSSF